MTVKAIELGCKGHLCVGRDCQWSRHTRVANFRISSIGDWYPRSLDGSDPKRETIGCDRFFETMVFRVKDSDNPDDEGCGCGETEFGELDFAGYKTAGEANAGHEKMVRRWLRKARQANRES